MMSTPSWSPAELRRYLLIETAVAVAIAVCLSVVFAWLFFAKLHDVTLRTPKLVVDTAIQSFIVAFMIAFPSTLVGRHRRRAGSTPAHAPWGRWPRNPVLRGLAFAAPAAVGLGLLHAACAPVLPASVLDLGALLGFKAALGAIIALVVAPTAVRAALGDTVIAHSTRPALEPER